MAIGNMHKKLVKIGHVVPEICWWTGKHTQTRSLQYSAPLSGVVHQLVNKTQKPDSKNQKNHTNTDL